MMNVILVILLCIVVFAFDRVGRMEHIRDDRLIRAWLLIFAGLCVGGVALVVH